MLTCESVCLRSTEPPRKLNTGEIWNQQALQKVTTAWRNLSWKKNWENEIEILVMHFIWLQPWNTVGTRSFPFLPTCQRAGVWSSKLRNTSHKHPQGVNGERWWDFEPLFSSVAQSCLTLCDPMNRSTPGLPVHHQLPEFTQTHIHWVSDAIQPSHPRSSPSSLAPNPSQHQSLFQWVNSSHEVAKVLEF